MNPSVVGSGLVLHQIRCYSSKRRMLGGHRPSLRCPRPCGGQMEAVWKALALVAPQRPPSGYKGKEQQCSHPGLQRCCRKGDGLDVFPLGFLFPRAAAVQGGVRWKRGSVGQLCPPPVPETSWSLVLAAQHVSRVTALFWVLLGAGGH